MTFTRFLTFFKLFHHHQNIIIIIVIKLTFFSNLFKI